MQKSGPAATVNRCRSRGGGRRLRPEVGGRPPPPQDRSLASRQRQTTAGHGGGQAAAAYRCRSVCRRQSSAAAIFVSHIDLCIPFTVITATFFIILHKQQKLNILHIVHTYMDIHISYLTAPKSCLNIHEDVRMKASCGLDAHIRSRQSKLPTQAMKAIHQGK